MIKRLKKSKFHFRLFFKSFIFFLPESCISFATKRIALKPNSESDSQNFDINVQDILIMNETHERIREGEKISTRAIPENFPIIPNPISSHYPSKI